jgi:hypothetical protein
MQLHNVKSHSEIVTKLIKRTEGLIIESLLQNETVIEHLMSQYLQNIKCHKTMSQNKNCHETDKNI